MENNIGIIEINLFKVKLITIVYTGFRMSNLEGHQISIHFKMSQTFFEINVFFSVHIERIFYGFVMVYVNRDL